MAKINKRADGKAMDGKAENDVRLAGGAGARAAVQGAEARLRRAVLATLLWEDVAAYQDGKSVSDEIAALIPQVAPDVVAGIAVEARVTQKLRHVPLFIAREMLRYPEYRTLVGGLLPAICTRPDQITDFLALYWHGQDGKDTSPLAKQVKIGLSAALLNFAENPYALAKYRGEGKGVTLRDVMFLTHPRPVNAVQAQNLRLLANNELPTPDTWEVILSGAASNGMSKKQAWEKVIDTWITDDA